jgi:predicted dehydrogenase
MKKLKVGIVGVGGISEFHISGYKRNPNVELYAFCDINEARLKEKGARHGITRLYTDVNEMVKLEELDAVSVCTWNSAHAPCTIAALNAGKHVLCEKPMAMNGKEAEEMLAAAKRSGKLLQIGFVRRFGNDCAILKDFVDNGDFGEIYYAKATYTRRHGCPGGWFSDKKRSGGGPLIDLGVHVIDLARYIAGCPKPVSAYGVTFDKLGSRPEVKTRPGEYKASDAGNTSDVEDFASALIRFENGFTIGIEASFDMNLPGENNIVILGTKAGATLSPDLKIYSTSHGYMTNVTLDMPTALDFNGLFEREIDDFVDCVLTGRASNAPAEDGVVLMKILSAIYESAATGNEVKIDC